MGRVRERSAASLISTVLPDHGPVPVRPMLCGLVGSFATVTVMVALSAEPPAVGVNFTAIVHDECGAVDVPQVPPATAKSLAFAPLKLSPNGSENPDKLVTVAFSVFDAFVSVPYAIEVGATVAGMVGPVLIAMVCGLSGSGLSAIDSVADSVPSAPGLNVTTIEHAWPAPRVVAHVPPVTKKSAAFVPPKLSLRVTVRV